MAGRIRSIKPELLDDEKTSSLDDTAWRLFVSSWLLADDHGNLRAEARYLASQVWQDTSRDAETPLQELARVGLVTVYYVRGARYARINGWPKHQRVDNAGKPRVPGPAEADGSGPSSPPSSPRREPAESLRESPRAAEAFGESRKENPPESKIAYVGESPRVSEGRGDLPLDHRSPTTDLDPECEPRGREHAHTHAREARGEPRPDPSPPSQARPTPRASEPEQPPTPRPTLVSVPPPENLREPVKTVLALLRDQPALAAVALVPIAEQIAGDMIARGTPIPWVKEALADAVREAKVSEATGTPLGAKSLGSLVLRFVANARSPRKPHGTGESNSGRSSGGPSYRSNRPVDDAPSLYRPAEGVALPPSLLRKHREQQEREDAKARAEAAGTR